ncbi:hypothetical protein F4809DRAFT_649530 [Biscogniauxia mediterranea]|nr:hypothetical protein F4809DRAFT_649530 [Biscogniauxia mediterranea]
MPTWPSQDGTGAEPSPQPSPTSSTLSSASTVDDDAPKLPARALNHLRTPPRTSPSPYTKAEEQGEEPQFVTTSWGSPYPPADSNHHRNVSFSSETSEDSPLHQLEINTPFLRPAPLILTTESEQPHASLSAGAAVLANHWIRQHTTRDLGSENRHWLSDGTDESEHSSLGGSISGDDAGWYEETDPRTPRAPIQPAKTISQGKRRSPRSQASNETLRQAILGRRVASQPEAMDILDVDRGSLDAPSLNTESSSDGPTSTDTPATADRPALNGFAHGPVAPAQPPATPARHIRKSTSQTPRFKKKVPWRGKNIMVLLPRDQDRGKPGKPPMPLDAAKLGYSIRGFDLDDIHDAVKEPEKCSQSRRAWPAPEDMAKERIQRQYQVTLPDLNAWKNYVNELQEAKLRALGVSFAEEEPAPPPSISPAVSNMSRQTSNQFPLPFSPPLPASSAASNGLPGFPFTAPFFAGNGSSATHSPGIPSVTSPISFNAPPAHGKFNPRASSISISPHELPFHLANHPSPHGWSPQLLMQQQQLARGGSPSVLNLNSLTSPTSSPFQRDGMSPPMGIHQRHQSLQYPMLPQHLQRQDSARASPRLQELREVDEEIQSNPYEGKSPSKTPEPTRFIRHNASESLQKEIDDAEYHLEEQFRSQLEHEDYSPHNENEKVEANNSFNGTADPAHARGPSVHFGGFGTDSDEGPKLHHPQPHSRGHSLSQQPYFDNEEARDSTDEGSINKPRPDSLNLHRPDNSYEIETNPSNLGTPVESFEFVNQLHDRSFSTASNPWADVQSMSRRPSHSSKPSLSKLNAAAAEFKFNPTSNFTPGQFIFGHNNPQSSPFQPAGFQQASFTSYPQSAASSHFSVPSTSSNKVNAAAPAFSPRRSDFSFSASGPKFNPDAKAFQPLSSFASSIASGAASGNEGAENRPSSIFSNIDLSIAEATKSAKKSKAIPIMRPTSSAASPPTTSSAQGGNRSRDGSVADTTRARKKFRDNNGDGNDVPQFAEPTMEREPKGEEDENAHMDTTFASTTVSESTDGKLQSESNDTKATTSPSATSPDHEKVNWKPFEFKNKTEMLEFDNARPFGEDEPSFKKEHKKSLSATAKPFVPTGFMFGAESDVNTPFNPVLKPEPPQMVEPAKESDDDRAGSPTPGPDTHVRAAPETEAVSQTEDTPALPAQGGLGSSRFASPPPAAKGLQSSRYASSPSPLPSVAGLAASRYAASPSPVSENNGTEPASKPASTNGIAPTGETQLHSFEPLPVSPPSETEEPPRARSTEDLTFEEIDEVMEHLSKNDPTQGAKRLVASPTWHHPNSPSLQAQEPNRGKAPSPNLAIPRASTEFDDPFMDLRRLNDKLEQRVQYFDRRVNNVKTLDTIHHVLGNLESDADDEDEDVPKLEQIRIAVIDALNQQQSTRTLQPAQLGPVEEESRDPKEPSVILRMLGEMKEQLARNFQVDFRPESIRSIVEEAVDDEESTKVLSEMQSKVIQLEERLHAEEDRVEKERARVLDLETKLPRRAAEDPETKVEVEIMNRSVFDQRVHDLEERLKAQETEDRLSEIQRLLRISSEEEDRLRSVLEDREEKIRHLEQTTAQSSMRLSLLDAEQSNSEQVQTDLKNRLAVAETEIRDARQEARHWRSEAEHARDSAHRQTDDFVQAVNENKHLHKLIDTLGVQLEENERIRDSWRAKFVSLQEDMAHAAREITEENARRTKKEQALIARQEVLDARLQAEARTRERLEVEVERLENGERAGMRAVGECKRLEAILLELRNENHDLHQNVLRYQREIKEARESAATELETANNQVNSVRNELEEEIARLRFQLDQTRLDADTARAHHEMMLEESQTTKQTALQEAQRAREKDLQARYERQISNAVEDAQRSEQNLLERLSLSTSKTEHLQDREAARAAAQAAAQAAKGAVVVPEQSMQPGPVAQTKQLAQAMQLPEKISPQALRESIMVLQEQLQAREQRIEELEQTVAKLDPDATTKIAKRDDEITWLRELLAVRHGDLQDIIGALSADKYDKEAVKDAAIRLKANLQMEEQERERAVNGGSSISLPSLAASLRGVATPRVAQAVGPLAAAWGSWRKGNQASLKVPRVSTSPAPARRATPSKANPAVSQGSFLSGLMTPPASSARNMSQEGQMESQPTAFGNTGRRFTAEQYANRTRQMTARQAEKMPIDSTPPHLQDQKDPVTPPMMRSNSYDADARVEEFDDASFFDD